MNMTTQNAMFLYNTLAHTESGSIDHDGNPGSTTNPIAGAMLISNVPQTLWAGDSKWQSGKCKKAAEFLHAFADALSPVAEEKTDA